MKKQVLTTSLIAWAVLCSSAAFGGLVTPHVVHDELDLYPYGNTASRNMIFWKDTVYVSADDRGDITATLHSVDVSDPDNLIYVSSGAYGGHKSNELIVVDDILYDASWFAFLRIFDVSIPGYFSYVSSFSPADGASWKIDVANDRAYLIESTDTESHGLWIIDISNPSSPSLVSDVLTDARTMGGVAVRGSYVYYGNSNHFEVANVSDEDNPYIVSDINLGFMAGAYPGNVNSVRLRGNYAYVGCEEYTGGLFVFDVSDPTNPVQVGNYTGNGARDMYLLGDYAFMAGLGATLNTVDISNPSNPHAVSGVNVNGYELSVTGSGRYIYLGTLEEYWNGDNYWRGKVFSVEVLTDDPDDAGPGKWKDFSPNQASWDLQYEADALPTASDPAWTLYEGSNSWASVTGGVLHINDTGTNPGDKVKWLYSWEATNTRGATVLVRARCPSYTAGGPTDYPINIMIHDGKYIEEIAILSDQIRSLRTTRQYALDGTAWHTYRITTQGDQFRVYVDEDPLPVIEAPLTVTKAQDPAAKRAMIQFGSGSSASTQDIYFDYVHCYSNGAFGPTTPTSDQTPDVSVNVWDIAGKGSMSGIAPSTARVHWSTDGGDTWNSSGGVQWQCVYEGDAIPSEAVPEWPVVEGSEVWASVGSGVLRVNDTGTVSGDKIKWSHKWNASPATGTTIIALARCAANSPDITYTNNLFVEDGSRREMLKILTDRIVTAESGQTYMLDGTAWHTYRMTTEGTQFKVYVDEDPTPVLQGTMGATTSQNRVMFGSGSSTGTQDIYFDYVRYTAEGALPPGQGDGGGPVTVVCTGQQGTDRGTIAAYSVPFNQYSRTLNKVKFSIRDTLGNIGWSPVYTVSIVDNTTLISDVKSEPDGTVVSLAGKVLYLKEADFAYIEEPNRTSGIRLEGTISANQDQLVELSGSMQTTTWGERYIAVSNMQAMGSGQVGPVGVTNAALRDAMLDGCYVTAWGTVLEGSIWEGFFYITDGADLDGIKVMTEGMPTVDEGDFVVVTGAAGLEDFGRGVHAMEIQVVGP